MHMFLVNYTLNNKLTNPLLSITDILQPNELRYFPEKKKKNYFQILPQFSFLFYDIKKVKVFSRIWKHLYLVGSFI